MKTEQADACCVEQVALIDKVRTVSVEGLSRLHIDYQIFDNPPQVIHQSVQEEMISCYSLLIRFPL